MSLDLTKRTTNGERTEYVDLHLTARQAEAVRRVLEEYVKRMPTVSHHMTEEQAIVLGSVKRALKKWPPT